jgi:hypothetical protein
VVRPNKLIAGGAGCLPQRFVPLGEPWRLIEPPG